MTSQPNGYLKAIVGTISAILVMALASASAQARYPIDLKKAEEAFSEAKQISNNDGGRLWGKLLYGPMLLVDPTAREKSAGTRAPRFTSRVPHASLDLAVGWHVVPAARAGSFVLEKQ